jgi:hypothetical protein
LSLSESRYPSPHWGKRNDLTWFWKTKETFCLEVVSSYDSKWNLKNYIHDQLFWRNIDLKCYLLCRCKNCRTDIVDEAVVKLRLLSLNARCKMTQVHQAQTFIPLKAD